jgi:phospholipid transport system substrate-binding protein
VVLLLASGAAADPAVPPAPDAEQATRVVEGLHAAMLDVMKQAQQLGYEGRLARLQPAIESRYDFAFIAEKSVGLTWKDLDTAQRAKLVDVLGRLAGANYAARMADFSGELFETIGTESASQGTILVRTRVLDEGSEPIPLDYRLRSTPDLGPRIVDVFYDGTVSELAMRRSARGAAQEGRHDALLKRSRRRSRSRRPPAPHSEHALRARTTRDREPRGPAPRASASRRCARRRRSRSNPRAARAVPRAGCRVR